MLRGAGEGAAGCARAAAGSQGGGEASRHGADMGSRRGAEPGMKAGAGRGCRHAIAACSREPGRARAPLQGAGIWARASGARRLGAQRGRLGQIDEVAAARVREVNRTFFMGRCIFPLWAGPRYGERHTSPHWALRH